MIYQAIQKLQSQWEAIHRFHLCASPALPPASRFISSVLPHCHYARLAHQRLHEGASPNFNLRSVSGLILRFGALLQFLEGCFK